MVAKIVAVLKQVELGLPDREEARRSPKAATTLRLEWNGVSEGTRTPDLRDHKAVARQRKHRNGGTFALGAPRHGPLWVRVVMIGPRVAPVFGHLRRMT